MVHRPLRPGAGGRAAQRAARRRVDRAGDGLGRAPAARRRADRPRHQRDPRPRAGRAPRRATRSRSRSARPRTCARVRCPRSPSTRCRRWWRPACRCRSTPTTRRCSRPTLSREYAVAAELLRLDGPGWPSWPGPAVRQSFADDAARRGPSWPRSTRTPRRTRRCTARQSGLIGPLVGWVDGPAHADLPARRTGSRRADASVREATAADAPAMGRVQAEAWRASYADRPAGRDPGRAGAGSAGCGLAGGDGAAADRARTGCWSRWRRASWWGSPRSVRAEGRPPQVGELVALVVTPGAQRGWPRVAAAQRGGRPAPGQVGLRAAGGLGPGR